MAKRFRFRDVDALNLRQKPSSPAAALPHLSKRKRADRDLEVAFNPQDYK
jgi:hypothetical protein